MNNKSLHNASYGKKLNLFLMRIRKRNGFLFLNTLSFKISLKFVTRTMIVCIGVLYKSYKYILKFTRKISPNATKICHFSPQNTFLKVQKSVIIPTKYHSYHYTNSTITKQGIRIFTTNSTIYLLLFYSSP